MALLSSSYAGTHRLESSQPYRFDKPAEERAKSNLIVLSAAEGQEILTPRIRLLPESTASSGASARF